MFAYYAEGVGNADIRELVLGVFHLSCSKVYQGALDGVLFVAEDEDIWATDSLHQINSVKATNLFTIGEINYFWQLAVLPFYSGMDARNGRDHS